MQIKEDTKIGIHKIHFVKQSKTAIIFVAILAIIMITLSVKQSKEISELRKEMLKCRSAWMQITGENL